jgi:tol-pal system protein YbgF
MRPYHFIASLLIMTTLSAPVLAQNYENNPAMMDRMERMDRDMQLMQRQLARGGPSSGSSASIVGDAPVDASLTVRLSAMEEELRALRGKIEENDFQTRQLKESFEKYQKDAEFRFNELSKGGAGNAELPADAPRKAEPKNAAKTVSEEKPVVGGPTSAGDGILRKPEEGKTADESNFATPRDHYNYAFRLLNQTHYEESATAFESFTKKYPKDPLIGNAYYWLGETFYIRGNYVDAADNFRQGFETLPNGPKAADNLLKLAMSLNALNRNKEACVVLDQVTSKFAKNSTSVADKASQEQKRIGCK